MNRRAQLSSQLHEFRPVDALEAAHCERMRALLVTPGDPFAGEHYEPGHFTASAFVLSPSRQELLLIHHSKLNLWLQPGGHIEPDDASVLHAAQREVLEEVGIAELDLDTTQPFDLDVHTIPARKAAPAHEHFDVRFLFIARDRVFSAGSDALSARWAALPELERAGTDESVLRAVRKLQKLGLTQS